MRSLANEGQRPVYEASQFAVVYGLRFPSRVGIVVKSVCVIDYLLELLDGGVAEYLLRRSNRLPADTNERAKQCFGRELLRTCDTKERFEVRTNRPRYAPPITCAVCKEFAKHDVAAIVL